MITWRFLKRCEVHSPLKNLRKTHFVLPRVIRQLRIGSSMTVLLPVAVTPSSVLAPVYRKRTTDQIRLNKHSVSHHRFLTT